MPAWFLIQTQVGEAQRRSQDALILGLAVQPRVAWVCALSENTPVVQGERADFWCMANATAAVPCAIARTLSEAQDHCGTDSGDAGTMVDGPTCES